MSKNELSILEISATASSVSNASVAPTDPDTLSTAEVAECTCPDFCDRDHDLD